MTTTATAPATAESTPAATTTTVPPHERADFDPMKFAQEADARTAEPQAQPTETHRKPDTTPPGEQGKPDAGKEDTKTAKRDDATPGEQGAETAYTKAQKERARQESLLKGFQKEKEAFQQEKQALAAKIAGYERELQQLRQAPTEPAKDQHGITADTYEQLARKYREEGNDDMAREALNRAERLRRQQPAAKTSAQAPQDEAWKTPEFQQAWSRTTDEILKEQPELADPKHPLVAATNTLVTDPTWGAFFRARPDGLRAAVEVAKLMQKSAQAEALQKSFDTANAEIARLNKLTQPRGGNPAPAGGSGAKAPSEMTLDDVMAAARAADESG